MKTNVSDMFLRPLAAIITLLLVLLPGCAKTATNTKTAPLPGTPAKPVGATTGPAGKWSCWTGQPSLAAPRCVTPGAIWFAPAKTGHIWRYDRKTGEFQAFSALDGLPLENGIVLRVAAASDERCAILVGGPSWGGVAQPSCVFLWQPKNGWAAVPLPESCYVLDIAFDLKDRFVALGTKQKTVDDCEITEFRDGKWQHLCAAASSQALFPVVGGYVVQSCRTPPGMPYYVFTFIPADARDDLTKAKTFNFTCLPPGWARPSCFFAGGKTFAMLDRELCEMSCDGPRVVRPNSKGWLCSVCDMKAADALVCREAEVSDDCITLRVEADGVPEIKLPRDYFGIVGPFTFLRDPDGNYWFGTRRWDGKKWLDFNPPWQFPTQPLYGAGLDRLQLDADGKTWSIRDPQIPLWAACYDPVKHTAWSSPPWRMAAPKELQLIRQDGTRLEVVRRVPFDQIGGVPQAQSADGDYWLAVESKSDKSKREVVRITASGTRRYAYDLQSTWLRRSPNGEILVVESVGDVVRRYDAKADAFVKDDLLELFAVTVGGRKFAIKPGSAVLYAKSADGWHQFLSPFSRYPVNAYEGAFHGDCVLMQIDGIGVMEYNAKLDIWIRLVDCGGLCFATYDSRGRRIIFGNCVLAYEGDPWASVADDNEDQATFDRLLKQMDDRSYKVREEAAKAMAAAMGKFGKRMSAASNDLSLSAEVRARLKSILQKPPPALFRTMHPVLTSAK
jgi:hypothetical protein